MGQTTPPLDQIDPAEAWQPWEPSAKDPFDLKWAGHLYRRAAFGASPAEMNEAVARGLPATLDLLTQGRPGADDLEKTLEAVGARTAERGNAFELRAWWVYAMLNGGRPVQGLLRLTVSPRYGAYGTSRPLLLLSDPQSCKDKSF